MYEHHREKVKGEWMTNNRDNRQRNDTHEIGLKKNIYTILKKILKI